MDPLKDAINFVNQAIQQSNRMIAQIFPQKPENSYRQSLRESTEPMGEIHSPGIRGERHTRLLPTAKNKVPSRVLRK